MLEFISYVFVVSFGYKEDTMIVVIGSINLDTVINVNHFPVSGETTKAISLKRNLGGKGANQAICSARLGSECLFINSLGNDYVGNILKEELAKEGMILRSNQSKLPSGEAFIEVDNEGMNRIIINSGANSDLSIEFVESLSQEILKASVILLQGEIPWETNKYIINRFSSLIPIIFDPAPASKEMLDYIDKVAYITPNESEFEELSGHEAFNNVEVLIKSAVHFQERIKTNLILKMGELGCCFVSDKEIAYVPSIAAGRVIDTTGAGDVFNAAFAHSLDIGEELSQALRIATAASAICVTRFGAAPSIPNIGETMELIANMKEEISWFKKKEVLRGKSFGNSKKGEKQNLRR
ncbi:MAG TPA: ribokinase [Clostridiales bacterium]|nr:ribokinase [Clostridiales bacterium]